MNRLREMLNEEEAVPVADQRAQMEIPEDTPHYLNPKALAEEKNIPYDEEENTDAESFRDTENDPTAEKNDDASSGTSVFAGQSPEQVENVLNQGMGFIGSLLEMATGKKMEATEKNGAMVKIDRETGEVTMKFKLPGF